MYVYGYVYTCISYQVHFSIKRAATGAIDYVVCVRAPLNYVEHVRRQNRQNARLYCEQERDSTLARESVWGERAREGERDFV